MPPVSLPFEYFHTFWNLCPAVCIKCIIYFMLKTFLPHMTAQTYNKLHVFPYCVLVISAATCKVSANLNYSVFLEHSECTRNNKQAVYISPSYPSCHESPYIFNRLKFGYFVFRKFYFSNKSFVYSTAIYREYIT